MKNIIEYKKSEFINLLLEKQSLIDNLFIFEMVLWVVINE